MLTYIVKLFLYELSLKLKIWEIDVCENKISKLENELQAETLYLIKLKEESQKILQNSVLRNK